MTTGEQMRITIRTDDGDRQIGLQDVLQDLFDEAMRLTTAKGGQALTYYSTAVKGFLTVWELIKDGYQRHQREEGLAQKQRPIRSDPSPWKYQDFPSGWRDRFDDASRDLFF